MINGTDGFPVQRVTGDAKQDTEDMVIREIPFTIMLNGREVSVLHCSPVNLECLAVGFLVSGGYISGKEALGGVEVDEEKCVARVTAEGIPHKPCLRYSVKPAVFEGSPQITSQKKVSAARILALVERFQRQSRVFRETGGVHGAALCDENRVIVFAEDIGRYNALDRVIGRCVLDNIPMARCIMITSGRVFSETVRKVGGVNIPILVSRSATTDLGIKLAADLGMTLVGFARGERMNVYTGVGRITVGA